MGTLIFLLVVLIIVIVAAWYLGFDSTERVNSCEWERRANWSGINSPHH